MSTMEVNADNNTNPTERTVFVGNIPFFATEEEIKGVLSMAGPVVFFKLMLDSETNRPLGYGFCEYRDKETALSAIRNVTGSLIAGRSIRVTNACTAPSRMEMQQMLATPEPEKKPYADPVPPEQATEVITQAVCSMQPEQLLKVMREMKMSVKNNPSDIKKMLSENPQLAYALLQGLVVIKAIDSETASSMLAKPAVSVKCEYSKSPSSQVPSEEPVAGCSGYQESCSKTVSQNRRADPRKNAVPQKAPAIEQGNSSANSTKTQQ